MLSIPKKVWIATCCLVGSILLGWIIAVFAKGVSLTLNNVLELGGFGMGLVLFLLILFYTRNDKSFAQYYLYALLVPVVYSIFILFPGLAYYFDLARDGTFLGITNNPNIISKTLITPSLFFMVSALFESKKRWLKVAYILLSCTSVALLFWCNSRGAVLGLAVGAIFVWLIFSLNAFTWKKLIYGGTIILLILVLGFSLTPGGGKQAILNRILNPRDPNSDYHQIKDKSLAEIVSKSLTVKPKSDSHIPSPAARSTVLDSRLQIWPAYLKLLLINPWGFGPNTHMNVVSGGKDYNIGPHNTYIEVLLWGGIIGIFSFLYLLGSTFKNLKIQSQSNLNRISVAVLGTLIAFAVSFVFNDSLQFFWFWIILALSWRV